MKQEQKRSEQEKIAAVEKIVGKAARMNKNDKLLYYENHIEPTNRFKDILNFPSIGVSRWLNYLCNDENLYNDFMNLFCNNYDVFDSLMQFRGYLMNEQHRGQNIDAYTIEQLVTTDNYNQLKDIIQELFLEPICNESIKRLAEAIKKNKLSAIELILWHQQKPGKRLNYLLSMC